MQIDKILAKIFGTKHEREVKAMRPIIASINELAPQMEQLSDEELAAQTVRFREQLAEGATLDSDPRRLKLWAAVSDTPRKIAIATWVVGGAGGG